MPNLAPDFLKSTAVYMATDFTVISGVNLGDAISFAAELHLDDIYTLRPAARLHQLSARSTDGIGFDISPSSGIGSSGNMLYPDCCLTMMSMDGQTVEVLILVEVSATGYAAAVYALPLTPLDPHQDYALISINRRNPQSRFSETSGISFARGTHITLASGRQSKIEDLTVGDRILTRDSGPQEIRWIGHCTVRAVGNFAPVRIRAGTLHNEHDLLIGPDHRLFIYQRTDTLGIGRRELLIRARNLVNGDTVIRQKGGFIDYYQILCNNHQIIYAEGIGAETLLVEPDTSPALPGELAREDPAVIAGHSIRPHLKFELGGNLLDHPDMAKLLCLAST